ncbi:hypothetical protein FQA39_LY00356 [Lamprigera yunnana]|nr:hypothetical protein FQA39_LY00356 [Lamprigera yunnana]
MHIVRDHDFAIHSAAANGDRPTICEPFPLETPDRPGTSSGSAYLVSPEGKTIATDKGEETCCRKKEDCSESHKRFFQSFKSENFNNDYEDEDTEFLFCTGRSSDDQIGDK